MSTACAVCGTEIHPKRHGSHRVYCDLRCKRRAQEIRIPRRKPYVESHCRYCEAVLPPPHPNGGGPREYCNPRCRDAARRGARKPRHRHCEYCSATIEGISTKRFCSNRCRKRARRGVAGEQHCAQCHKPLPPKRLKFCNNQCRYLARQGGLEAERARQRAEEAARKAAEKIRRQRRAEAELHRKAEAKAERERIKHLKPSPQELHVMRVGWPGARKAA